MKTPLIALAVLIAVSACRKASDAPAQSPTTPIARGSVRGHVRLEGPVPENQAIRMSADPMCKAATGGGRAVDEAVVASPEGSLANVFVELVGTFPETPAPAEPVSIDQNGCVYRPRVVGVRVGQALRVGNSDDGLHNVHGVSDNRDTFNVSQPVKGMVNTFHPQEPGILRLKCDVHTWMVAFVGVVNHPFFAVTGKDGGFVLENVPEGTYDVRAWHERFGSVTSSVHVDAGRSADIDVVYSGDRPSN
jgi:plastocyanin